MIDDMASLKQAMEQMDSQDPAVAEAAKTRAAHILSESKLSFSKMAELIEQRRLLLRPRIIASIKRMDQPDMLGEAAFRDAGSALRREGQSFRQIAESIELNGGPALRYEDPVQPSEPLHPMEMEIEPGVPAWLRLLNIVARIVFYPLRRPIRFFVIALIGFMLFNTLRGLTGGGRQISGYVADISAARQRVDKAMSSVSSFVSRRSQEAAAPPTPPAPIPSPPASTPSPSDATPSAAPTNAPAPPATTPAPSATNEAAPAPPSAAPAAPPASTPNLDARSIPRSKSAANDRPRTVRPPAFEDLIAAAGIRRNSRLAGPCVGGVGGCYWGGGRY
jgi:hypothetical protein